jgi:hypothetical protein
MSQNTRSWLACLCIVAGLVEYRFAHSDHGKMAGTVVVIASFAIFLAWELASRMSAYRAQHKIK